MRTRPVSPLDLRQHLADVTRGIIQSCRGADEFERRSLFFEVGGTTVRSPTGCLLLMFCSHFQRVFNFCLLPSLDQDEVGMVNATVHVAGDGYETPLGIEDFQ